MERYKSRTVEIISDFCNSHDLTTKALGWIDEGRMKKDYDLVQTCLGMEKPLALESAFTSKLLDRSVKMDAGKVPK